jgi:hypothetical protein
LIGVLSSFWPVSGEEIPKAFPPEKGPSVKMTVYENSDQTINLVKRRAITRILVMLNISPIR